MDGADSEMKKYSGFRFARNTILFLLLDMLFLMWIVAVAFGAYPGADHVLGIFV